MDCNLPGFSDQAILQARTLEWVAISFSSPALRQSNLNFIVWGLSVFFFLTAPWVISSLRYSHGWEPVWYTDSDNSGWEINFDESSLVACYQSRMLAIHRKLKMPRYSPWGRTESDRTEVTQQQQQQQRVGPGHQNIFQRIPAIILMCS